LTPGVLPFFFVLNYAVSKYNRSMEYLTNSAEGTKTAAKKIIIKLLKRPHQGALVLVLVGELGAGKTTFVQGLAKTLGVKEKILSPTFVIQKRFMIYDLRFKNKFKNLYHLDCYRIENAKNLAGLGLEEILKDKKNLVVIEWAERVANILPADTVWLNFQHKGGDKRKITI